MSRRKKENEMVRKITWVGGLSYSATLPLDVVRRCGWKERQKVVLEMDDLFIKDWPARPGKK